MFTIFVSHQWLSPSHPDPHGRQLAVLRGALQHMVDGSLEVEADPIAMMHGGSPKVDARTREATVFGNALSIPAVVG